MADKGKQILKKSAFYGNARITNKAVRYVDSLDEKGVVNTAVKRKEVYEKFKDFGRKGRGLTDKEAKMALAELKYGNDDHLSKKSVNTLAQEMGFGKGKITKKLLRSAKKYKQRSSYSSTQTISDDLKKKADERITARRDEYAKKVRFRQEKKQELSKDSGTIESHRLAKTKRRDVRGVRRQLGQGSISSKTPATSPSPRRLTRSSVNAALTSTSPSFSASRLMQKARRPMNAQSRLSRGMRGRFGASHRSITRLP